MGRNRWCPSEFMDARLLACGPRCLLETAGLPRADCRCKNRLEMRRLRLAIDNADLHMIKARFAQHIVQLHLTEPQPKIRV